MTDTKSLGCRPWIIDGVPSGQAYSDGKRIITEGANAAMLDIDYGTYRAASSPTAGICTDWARLTVDFLGVIKAYGAGCAGAAPTELTDTCGGIVHAARQAPSGAAMGFEIGVTTGRKRRCGGSTCP